MTVTTGTKLKITGRLPPVLSWSNALTISSTPIKIDEINNKTPMTTISMPSFTLDLLKLPQPIRFEVYAEANTRDRG
jgi:hypothetical protein